MASLVEHVASDTGDPRVRIQSLAILLLSTAWIKLYRKDKIYSKKFVNGIWASFEINIWSR